MNDRNEEFKRITAEFEANKKKFVEENESHLRRIEGAINNQYQEFYSERLSYIRNLSVASGAIAPFSLTLLQISPLNIYDELLVFGFVTLLGNILFMQYILFKDLNDKDTNLAKAFLYKFFAESDLKNVGHTDAQKSVDASFSYIKNTGTATSHLSANKIYLEQKTTKTNSLQRKQLRVSYYALIIGVILIACSVLLPILTDFSQTYFSKLQHLAIQLFL